MKKKFRLYIAITFVVFLCVAWSISTSAASYPDTLRVGIYYGSGTVQSMEFQSDIGFTVGYSADRSFYSFSKIPNTSVTVTQNPSGSCHILYSSHSSAAEMNAEITKLKASGLSVFPAYYNSAYCIFGGSFQNINTASAENNKNTVKGTPVTLSAKALSLKDTKTGQLLFVTDSPSHGLGVFSSDRFNTDALLTISGTAKGTYRGGFECKLLGSGITVVNIAQVEPYLYSVVCREMSPSWHVEALKAQAVCARNFALRRINYHKSYGFDVCRTTCCQAYATTADKSQNVHKAVDETKGELLFHKDELVLAVYSSSMGSSTESVEYVWGSPYPYLVSVDNPYEDTENINNGKWTKKLTKERATEIMNKKGYNIGTVTDIVVTERTPSGGVLKLLVKGTNGEKTFERESCRTTFSEATYSQRYTVSSGGTAVYPNVSVITKDKTQTKTLTSASVLSGNNQTQKVSEKYVATDGKKNTTYKTTVSDGDANTFVFIGEGWGHGVGMSQYGAKGMAEAGIGYKEILTHYYTGTHLEKAY